MTQATVPEKMAKLHFMWRFIARQVGCLELPAVLHTFQASTVLESFTLAAGDQVNVQLRCAQLLVNTIRWTSVPNPAILPPTVEEIGQRSSNGLELFLNVLAQIYPRLPSATEVSAGHVAGEPSPWSPQRTKPRSLTVQHSFAARTLPE